MGEIGTRARNWGNLGQKWVAGIGGPRRRSFCRRWKTTGIGRRPEMEDSRNWKNDGVGRRWSSKRWRARVKHLVGTGRMTELETVAGSCESGCRNRKNDIGFGGRWREGGRENLGGRQK
jgi:hypothetical protein